VSCLPPHLPPAPKSGRLIVLAAGKAAGSMAEVAEATYADAGDRLTGIAVAREGYGRPTNVIQMIEAGHPIPNAAGLAAAQQALRLAASAGGTIWCWCCSPVARRRTGSRLRTACRS